MRSPAGTHRSQIPQTRTGHPNRAFASGRVFLVDYQLPTDPHNREVVRMIRMGGIGPLIALNSHYFAGPFSDLPRTATIESRLRGLVWCNDVAIGGGYHLNACIHAVDAALWVAQQRLVAAAGFSRAGRLLRRATATTCSGWCSSLRME